VRARLRAWWTARTLRARVTIVVGAVALVTLLLLSRLGVGLLTVTLLGAADVELRADATTAAGSLAAGTPPADLRTPVLRVVDTGGTPVDGGPALPLADREVKVLAAGEGVVAGEYGELRRYLAVPAVAPDGSPRLVVAVGDIVGGAVLIARAAGVFVLAALAVSVIVAAAAWLGTRAVLRPVERMRAAAGALPPGERLPVPRAHDELRALAEEINRLLARRDDAVARLQAFTGDAAHELRSPVAAIRAQAEVAVAHPDPELAGETLRSVAVEAERLTDLLGSLLALARADSGRRPDPQPVDLVAAAGAAVARVDGPDGPAVELVASAPACAAAGAGEVDLVLDNLLANARRHARSRVGVAVLPAGRWVRLVVEDDGPGIPPADRARVFDRFVRLDPQADGGAGLGLALVAALVQGRGGAVVAGESASGGARLEARWPAAP
jgi:two-component system, OmpR family, sensor kinase